MGRVKIGHQKIIDGIAEIWGFRRIADFHEEIDTALVGHRGIARNEAASERVYEHFQHFMAANLAQCIDIAVGPYDRQGLSVLIGMKTTSAWRDISADYD